MWIARDEDGDLWLYEKKPLKQHGYWACISGDCQILDLNLFPEVKCSDQEPRELVLKPIKKNKL